MFKKCFLNTTFRNYCKKSDKPYFITTPIFYVNAAPHIGHLYSAVISDAISRFEKLINNNPVYIFATGTDEHGSKIQEAAEKHKIPLIDYCTQISQEYRELFTKCNIDYTTYIRTTEDRHFTAVKTFWNELKSRNHIYRSKYEGWYCVSDETFLTESQLKLREDGQKISIESGHPVEWTEEDNYLFKLSTFQNDVIHWIKSGDRIVPKKFEKILLDNLMEMELPDVSISRPTSRVHWGIRVPGDDSQTIYVWLDALINYLSCIGYPNNDYKKIWPADVQVIGKDIIKFHGIYWPAFLIAAGLEPPNKLLVHSHWTVDGQKMSKSKQNVIDPNERSAYYTYEGLRYFLLREGVAHSDGNYSDTKIFRILNSELADTLGNLLSRGCAKTLNPKQIFPKFNREQFEILSQLNGTKKLLDLIDKLPEKCYQHYKSYNFYLVIDHIIGVLHAGDNFFEITKPWELRKINDIDKLNTIICITLETLRICGILLQPIVPILSKQLLDKLMIDDGQRKWSNLNTRLWDQQENKNNISQSIIQNDRPLNNDINAILFKRIQIKDNRELFGKDVK